MEEVEQVEQVMGFWLRRRNKNSDKVRTGRTGKGEKWYYYTIRHHHQALSPATIIRQEGGLIEDVYLSIRNLLRKLTNQSLIQVHEKKFFSQLLLNHQSYRSMFSTHVAGGGMHVHVCTYSLTHSLNQSITTLPTFLAFLFVVRHFGERPQ